MMRGYYVAGDIIKKKRKQLKKTQRSIYESADIDERTLRSMENKKNKRFELDTIKKVANALGITADNIIQEEISSFITIKHTRKVDFRCMEFPDPKLTSNKWKESNLAISLLPVKIDLNEKSPEPVIFENASLTIPAMNPKEKYDIFYKVELNSSSRRWDGCVDNFKSIKIAPGDFLESEYLFFCRNVEATSWSKFVEFVEYYDDIENRIIDINIRYEFDNDYFDFCLELSIDQLQYLLSQGRARNKFEFPRYIQPNVQRMSPIVHY